MPPRTADRFSTARLRLRSAYTPSQPVIDRRMFAGRTELLTTLIRAVEDERLHTIVYGERGIGKTSLMHVMSEAAREARYLVAYISCGANSNFDETFRAVAGDIPLLFHSGFGPTAPQAEQGAVLADLLPAGPVSVRMATDQLAKIVGTRVLVVLDEFDRVESDEFRRNIAEFIKNLSDRSVRVQLLIAGVADSLTELVEHIPSIQRSIFAVEVPRMTATEARLLVKNGEKLTGLDFNEMAIALIVEAANGLPYLASLLSHHAGLHAINSGRLTVNAQDVAEAVSEAVPELKGRVSKRSQAQIAACMRDGKGVLLSGLSHIASFGAGAFSASDLEAAWTPEGTARAETVLEKLAAEMVLIERHDDEFGRKYRFIEDSVPLYLCLLASQMRHAQASVAQAAS